MSRWEAHCGTLQSHLLKGAEYKHAPRDAGAMRGASGSLRLVCEERFSDQNCWRSQIAVQFSLGIMDMSVHCRDQFMI